MENPNPRASFDRLIASAKRAGLLKALFEAEGLAIIEIPVPQVTAPPPALIPTSASPAIPSISTIAPKI